MLPDSISSLILQEHERQSHHLVEGVDIEVYLAKLAAKAEILSDSVADRCRGFVAFYCNDQVMKRAFITMVIVNPGDRGMGIGRALVACVLDLARRRGFTSCRLEVDKTNEPARAMYRTLGFGVIEDHGAKDLMEIAL